jgi:hypothetical protein
MVEHLPSKCEVPSLTKEKEKEEEEKNSYQTKNQKFQLE